MTTQSVPSEPLAFETAPIGFDTAIADSFADRLVDTVNHAATALMISVGHRTRLFDAMLDRPPMSCVNIANAASLNERYVREWLASMVTAGIVVFDASTARYSLPAEHAALLARDGALDNMATMFQFIPLLGGVEDGIVDSFHNGGGVPYESFPRFHEVMAEESSQTVVAALEEHILPLAPGLVERLENGIDVLDVGCGSGRAMALLARTFPKSNFVGYDFSEEAVARARGLSGDQRNLRFERQDLTSMRVFSRFDLITAFDAIHDQAQPAVVLNNIHRALRPNGLFLMQDISGSSRLEDDARHPLGTLLYTISCMHCMTVSLAQGGAGLGAMWGRELAERMLADAGFSNVEVKQLPHDVMNDYYLAQAE
jgi:SAM-dependent methyltransferase